MKNIITLKGITFLSTIILCFSFATIKSTHSGSNRSVKELVDSDEPGQRIKISGQLLNLLDGTAISNTRIFFFQANNFGNYEPKIQSDERTARISGEIVTDQYGQFQIMTIMPGKYINSPKSVAHIHAEITLSNSKKIAKDILFDHDLSDEIRHSASKDKNMVIIKLEDKDSAYKSADLILKI